MSKSLGIAAVIAVAIGMSNEPEPGLSLTTLFASNNGSAGNTFDLEVLNPQGVEITGWDVNLGTSHPTDTIDIYWRVGTSVGHENNPTGWMLIGSDAGVVSQGTDVPTPVDVGPLELSPGVYGIYVDWASTGAGAPRLRISAIAFNGRGRGEAAGPSGVIRMAIGLGARLHVC